MLYRGARPWADADRGLARGTICGHQGRLVATVLQEACLPLP
ncbi:hypothetical protein [Solimonas soli]